MGRGMVDAGPHCHRPRRRFQPQELGLTHFKRRAAEIPKIEVYANDFREMRLEN